MYRCIYVAWMESLEWVIVMIMIECMRQDVGWPHDHELNWVGLFSNLTDLCSWIYASTNGSMWWANAWYWQEKLFVCDILAGSKLGLIYIKGRENDVENC